jgi:replicative DNA helicase
MYLSLELTAPEVFEHFRRIHKFWFPKATREEMLEDYALVQITEINRMRPGDLRELIGEYEENTKRRPALVLIDYLQYYARGFRGTSGHERANEAVMDIKADAKAESVAVIVPSQVNRGSQPGKPITLNGARDSGVIEETGDFVLSLFRPEMADIANTDETKGNAAPAPRGSYQIQLLKSRHGGSGKVFTHRASPLSLAIADTLDKPNALRIEQEVAAYGRGMTYAEHEKALERMHAQEALVGL